MQISVIGAVVLSGLMQLSAFGDRGSILLGHWGGILVWAGSVAMAFAITMASTSSTTTLALSVLFTLWGGDHCHAWGRSGLLF